MRYLVIDLGSSSGKIYLARYSEGRKMEMEEIDHFLMNRSQIQGHVATNVFYIYDRILGVLKQLVRKGIQVQAMGIDSWCSDFAIVDMDSGAITLPVFYRDPWTDNYEEKIEKILDYESIYQLTSQRKISNSTLCQLLAYKEEYPRGLKGNKKILFLGDVLMYLFTGNLCSEVSVASYSQLYSTRKEAWEDRMFQIFDIPKGIQPPVARPGTVLGSVRGTLLKAIGAEDIKVVAPAVHDTASAAMAVAAREEENWAFLATGSWFLMSMETEQVADLDQSFRYQLSNTGLAFVKVLLKKNITAMWLVQECKRQWDGMGYNFSYPELAELAEHAEEFYAAIDTEYEGFNHPEDMVEEIRKFLNKTGQKVPKAEEIGQIVRIIYESIAFQSCRALKMLEDTRGQEMDVLYVIGGASRIRLLNQFLADVTGLPVRTGPSEASAMGNALLQAYGMGQIGSEEEMRKVAGNSWEEEEYLPKEHGKWLQQYQKYRGSCIRD